MRVEQVGPHSVVIRFPSWGGFVDFAESAPRRGQGDEARATGDNKLRWTGTATLEAAVALARDGWPEGMERASEIKRAVFERVTACVQVPVVAYDVEGTMLDIGRYCAGEPEHWGRWDAVTVSGESVRFLRLAVNITANSQVSAATMMARAGTVAAAIEALELCGARVAVAIYDSRADGSRHPRYVVEVPVKGWDEWLDTDRLAYTMGHPSVLRRLGFAVSESFPEAQQRAWGVSDRDGKGTAAPLPDWAAADIRLDQEALAWESEAVAVGWVMEALRAAGVAVEGGA